MVIPEKFGPLPSQRVNLQCNYLITTERELGSSLNFAEVPSTGGNFQATEQPRLFTKVYLPDMRKGSWSRLFHTLNIALDYLDLHQTETSSFPKVLFRNFIGGIRRFGREDKQVQEEQGPRRVTKD